MLFVCKCTFVQSVRFNNEYNKAVLERPRFNYQSVILQDRLSDTLDLLAQLKQAHWNVKGPNFIALHELFDKIWGGSQLYADQIAERIAQLGGDVDGTIQGTFKKSRLKKYPYCKDGREHVEAVSSVLAAYGKLIRKAIDQCEDLKDAGTMDLFTEISRGNDQYLWFVEAHLQAPK